jgi:Putative auto-transporter adhesin, head GIN domain
MKRLTLFILFLATALPSVAQTRETRTVGNFTRISYRVPGKLYLKQGSPQKVELEGPAEILKEIETEVSGDKLIIGKESRWMDWGWSSKYNITVYVTVPTIEAVSVAGSGNLYCEDKITVDNLDLSVSGSGSMRLAFAASGNVEADVSGSGDMDLKGSCTNFDSDVSGSGKVYVSASIKERADLGVSGSGKIQMQGNVRDVKAGISGSGRINAGELLAEKCDVRISGSGDLEVNVKEELEATISGSGSVTYFGEPKRVNTHSSGSGHVRKRDGKS